ncbi:hypothetical protein [Trueperella pyogenes]|nr:hypothetical protein [Trueperella pyogenes]MCI7689933.1 hypothetical protein [Trueperella pyogenes]QIU86966.1 hypothetical protein HEP79_06935 [Trueperella pyogenes]
MTMVKDILFWLRGRGQLTIAAVVTVSPFALFFGWGFIIQLDVDLPPGRGLELIAMLSYSLLATASHCPMTWLEKQSPRKLLNYRLLSLVFRSLFVIAIVMLLGLAITHLPANVVPFGQVFGLDQQSLSLAYFVQIAIGVLIVSYIAELVSLLSFLGALPFLAVITYIGLIYTRAVFHFVFPGRLDFASVWQIVACATLACAVAIAGHIRSQSRFN